VLVILNIRYFETLRPFTMLTSSLLLLASLGTGLVQAQLTLDDLYLENSPSSPRPYVIPHYANSHAVTIDSQLYRFTVTGPSSGNAFTLMSTNAPSSGSLGVLPHIHRKHYENFFSFKGRFQLWAQKGDNEQQARVLAQGDAGRLWICGEEYHAHLPNSGP
jgi:hypothetical protein